MELTSVHSKNVLKRHEQKLARRFWEEGLVPMKTVVDTVHDPFVVLDEHLRVVGASAPFYQIFHLRPKEVEWKALHEIGDGEWGSPTLIKLLRTILSRGTFFKGLHLAQSFPRVGWKTLLVSGRQMHLRGDDLSEAVSPVILLTFEDITDMMHVAERLGKGFLQKPRK